MLAVGVVRKRSLQVAVSCVGWLNREVKHFRFFPPTHSTLTITVITRFEGCTDAGFHSRFAKVIPLWFVFVCVIFSLNDDTVMEVFERHKLYWGDSAGRLYVSSLNN